MWVDSLRLKHVPEGLNVTQVLYAQSESWGFGPGANETEFIVYELPKKIAQVIQKTGVRYFLTMPEAVYYGNREYYLQNYSNWKETPNKFKLEGYINRYGFGIPIDPAIEDQIDNAMQKTGSFIASGKYGILIVIPDIQRVVFVHAG